MRSYIVNWLVPLKVDPQAVADRFKGFAPGPRIDPVPGKPITDTILFHPETSERRALILSLGQYPIEEFAGEEGKRLTGELLKAYEHDPDAGIHSAAEWTLRKWGQQKALDESDACASRQASGRESMVGERPGADLRTHPGPVQVPHGLAPGRAGSSDG